MSLTTQDLRTLALESGAVGFGVTDASPFGEARSKIHANRSNGMAAGLRFTYGDPDLATDVTISFPWARSLVVIAHPYLSRSSVPAEHGPEIGLFATADHYEPVEQVTSKLTERLRAHGYEAEALIDDNRLADRAAAVRAGVGWIGRSTMVLVPGHGPWTLLGTVVTNAVLQPTDQMTRGCGTCTDCIPACPTGAISTEGVDARRCIAAWLQMPGHLPMWIRPHIGTRIYGCDDCLTSCPPGHPALTRVELKSSDRTFDRLLALGDRELRDAFSWWYIPDRDPRFLRRNVLVAAGNSGDRRLLEAIEAQFDHRSSLVRGHAFWAYARLAGRESWHRLEQAYRTEKFPDAVRELESAMLMLRFPYG